MSEDSISEVTRRSLGDHFELSGLRWAGRLDDGEFLGRLYDLRKLPSTDHRFNDAAGDIYQHTVRNDDWGADWVFHDARFDLLRAPDQALLRFLSETVHPVVRPDADEAMALVAFYNEQLAPDGWRLVIQREVSGKPIFTAVSAGRAVVFDEVTGWPKVDRQLQEVRLRLEQAETEEQWQAVGLLCREVLITVAQTVFDPTRHPGVDAVSPSATDARRMLEAVFEAELKGSHNEEARGHAKAAVKLASALQHKRTADFQTAALWAEGAVSVVNMVAIVAGRRGGRSVSAT